MKRARPLLLLLALAAAGAFAYASLRPAAIVLTGIVSYKELNVGDPLSSVQA
jgi:hypothetical protein